MLTTFSLWGIYFASYLIDYILILVIYIMKQAAQTDETVRWKTDDFLIVGILIVFIVAAILITFYMRHMKPNTRIKAVPDRNITYEMVGGLLAQVTAVATTIYSDWWIPINLSLQEKWMLGTIYLWSRYLERRLLRLLDLVPSPQKRFTYEMEP